MYSHCEGLPKYGEERFSTNTSTQLLGNLGIALYSGYLRAADCTFLSREFRPWADKSVKPFDARLIPSIVMLLLLLLMFWIS